MGYLEVGRLVRLIRPTQLLSIGLEYTKKSLICTIVYMSKRLIERDEPHKCKANQYGTGEARKRALTLVYVL